MREVRFSTSPPQPLDKRAKMRLPEDGGRRSATAEPGQAATARASLPSVPKPEGVRCLGAVEANALGTLVARLSEKAWRREDAQKENDYEVFHHTRHVVFRFIRGNRWPWDYYSMPNWQVWQPWLMPVMASAAAAYGYRETVFPKAMLARLQAGHAINEHSDGAGSHPLTHRIHIPLVTNPQATFTVNGTDHHLAAGYAWEVNNLAVHSARNDGAEDRVHLVFEVFDGSA